MDELSIDDIKKKIIELTALKNELKNEEQAIKLTMNSIYGAIGNNYFACFNPDVAEAVTLQGQDLIKFSEKVVFKYFNEYWANDTELHQKLGITKARKVTNPMTIYGDTDSVFSTTQISIGDNKGNIFKIPICDFYEKCSSLSESILDERGNEIIDMDKNSLGFKSLNYKNNLLIFSKIKKIIRHKVRKPKWRITTESDKQVLVTNDHSVMVFRDGKKIAVKPSEINIEKDEILSVNIDI